MKITITNTSSITKKRHSVHHSSSYAVISDIIAYPLEHYISSSGKDVRQGINLDVSAHNYFFQDEINLESHDKTVINKYWKVRYNISTIVQQPSTFCVEYTMSQAGIYKRWLISIVKADDPRIKGNSTTPLRGCEDKVVLIVKVPDWAPKQLSEQFSNFDEAYSFIKKETEKRNYYLSNLVTEMKTFSLIKDEKGNFGLDPFGNQFKLTDKSSKLLLITGHLAFFYQDAMLIFVKQGRAIKLYDIKNPSLNRDYIIDGMKITFFIKKGYIMEVEAQKDFFFQHDLILRKMEKEDQERKWARRQKFNKLSQNINSEIVKKITRNFKGFILPIMEVVVKNYSKFSDKEILDILSKVRNGKDPVNLLKNIFLLLKSTYGIYIMKKVSAKAKAWKYLQDCLPEIDWQGNCDCAISAVKITAEILTDKINSAKNKSQGFSLVEIAKITNK